MNADNGLDLTLERKLAANPAQVWRSWTEPNLLRQWFAPKPYGVLEAEIDPVSGGIFRVAMCSPDGQAFPATMGCVLVAEPCRRLVCTDALGPGFRPNPQRFMTVDVRLEPAGSTGTFYHVTVRHASAEDRVKHEAMGFHQGWSTCLTQLDALAAHLEP